MFTNLNGAYLCNHKFMLNSLTTGGGDVWIDAKEIRLISAPAETGLTQGWVWQKY